MELWILVAVIALVALTAISVARDLRPDRERGREVPAQAIRNVSPPTWEEALRQTRDKRRGRLEER